MESLFDTPWNLLFLSGGIGYPRDAIILHKIRKSQNFMYFTKLFIVHQREAKGDKDTTESTVSGSTHSSVLVS